MTAISESGLIKLLQLIRQPFSSNISNQSKTNGPNKRALKLLDKHCDPAANVSVEARQLFQLLRSHYLARCSPLSDNDPDFFNGLKNSLGSSALIAYLQVIETTFSAADHVATQASSESAAAITVAINEELGLNIQLSHLGQEHAVLAALKQIVTSLRQGTSQQQQFDQLMAQMTPEQYQKSRLYIMSLYACHLQSTGRLEESVIVLQNCIQSKSCSPQLKQFCSVQLLLIQICDDSQQENGVNGKVAPSLSVPAMIEELESVDLKLLMTALHSVRQRQYHDAKVNAADCIKASQDLQIRLISLLLLMDVYDCVSDAGQKLKLLESIRSVAERLGDVRLIQHVDSWQV